MARQSLNLPYIILTGAILVVIIVGFVVLQPLLRSIQALRQAITTVQGTIAEKESFLLTIDRKITELAGQAQHEQQLAVVLPAEESMKDVLRLLHTNATAAGVTLTSVTNSGESERIRTRALQARGQLPDIPATTDVAIIGVQGIGTYQQIRVFVEQLERSPRLMDILAVKLDRDTVNLEQIKLELRLRTYHHKGDFTNG